jgi:hypothetical protein
MVLDLDDSPTGSDGVGLLFDGYGVDKIIGALRNRKSYSEPVLVAVHGNNSFATDTANAETGPSLTGVKVVFGDGQNDTLDFIENLAGFDFNGLATSESGEVSPSSTGIHNKLYVSGGSYSFSNELSWSFDFANMTKNGGQGQDVVTSWPGSVNEITDDADPDLFPSSDDVEVNGGTGDGDLVGGSNEDEVTDGDGVLPGELVDDSPTSGNGTDGPNLVGDDSSTGGDGGTPNDVGDDGATNIDGTSADPSAGVVPEWAANLTTYLQHADDFITI